jgi:hypothetical protein
MMESVKGFDENESGEDSSVQEQLNGIQSNIEMLTQLLTKFIPQFEEVRLSVGMHEQLLNAMYDDYRERKDAQNREPQNLTPVDPPEESRMYTRPTVAPKLSNKKDSSFRNHGKQSVFHSNSTQESEEDSTHSSADIELLFADKLHLASTPAAEINRTEKYAMKMRASYIKSHERSRKSFIERGIIEAEKAEGNIQVTMTKPLPPYDHIRLRHLSLRPVMEFYDDVIEYETAHRTSIYPVAYLIDKNVRREIANRTNRTFTEHTVLGLELKPLMKLLIRFVAPTSRLEFYNTMQTIPRFPDLPSNYRPSIINYGPWFKHCLSFISDFRRTYEFLSDGYDDDEFERFVPPCNAKEWGMVKLFTNLVPYKYATKLISNWKETSFKELEDFLQRFTAEITKIYKLHLSLNEFKYHFGGTDYVKLFTEPKRYLASPANRIPNRFTANSNERSGAPRPQRLHHISNQVVVDDLITAGIEEDYVLGAEAEPLDEQVEEDKQESDDEDDLNLPIRNPQQLPLPEEYEPSFDINDAEIAELAQMVYSSPDELHAFDQHATRKPDTSSQHGKPQQPLRGCFKMMLTGTCEKGASCHFSHHPSAIQTARDMLCRRANSQTYTSKPNSTSSQSRSTVEDSRKPTYPKILSNKPSFSKPSNPTYHKSA